MGNENENSSGKAKYEIKTAGSSEKDWFYSNREKDLERGHIGYLRGDYGKRGNEFWHTWFGEREELNTPEFKKEFDELINELRDRGLLKNKPEMSKYCRDHTEGKIGDFYGFKIETPNYQYYIRCELYSGDYDFRLYCYDKNQQILHQSKTDMAQEEPAQGLDF